MSDANPPDRRDRFRGQLRLAEALLSKPDVRLCGLSRRGEWPPEQRHLADRVELRGVDLCDRAAVEAVLREVEPEQIFHVAGYAHGRPFVSGAGRGLVRQPRRDTQPLRSGGALGRQTAYPVRRQRSGLRRQRRSRNAAPRGPVAATQQSLRGEQGGRRFAQLSVHARSRLVDRDRVDRSTTSARASRRSSPSPRFARQVVAIERGDRRR